MSKAALTIIVRAAHAEKQPIFNADRNARTTDAPSVGLFRINIS
jgi:hypothetical protein